MLTECFEFQDVSNFSKNYYQTNFVKQLLTDITEIFTGFCLMSGANIQARLASSIF